MKPWMFRMSQSWSDEKRGQAGGKVWAHSTGCDSPHCKAGVTETRRGQSLWGPFSSLSCALPHQGHREQRLK